MTPTDDVFATEITAAEWAARTAPERVPDVIDWQRLRACALEPLRIGQPAVWHAFDGLLPDGSCQVASATQRRDPAPVIILEGAYSVASSRT